MSNNVIMLSIVIIAALGLVTISPQAFATNNQVTISSGAANTKGMCTTTTCFNPQTVNIGIGDTVTWTNDDSVGHTATSGHPSDNQTGTVFDSSLIAAGKSYTSPAFNSAGTYNYFCQVHPWMTGQIIVGGGAPATNPPPPPIPPNTVIISKGASNTGGTCTSTDCFNPQVLNIGVGNTVTWTNDDSVGHTATSGNPSDNRTGTVFDSSLIAVDKSYTSPAFNTAGTYNYFCQVHPWMTGMIIVGSGISPTTENMTTPTAPITPPPVLNASSQDIASINQAKNNQTIAAEVNVGANNTQTTSIDNNVSVKTTSNTPDTVGVQVSAANQTGPKVIVFNIAATTINVQNLKDLGVTYDGSPIQPATSIDAILHAKPTDNPSFAIVVTQSGVQVLVLIPHFSTHTITITNMSKVISPVPEFGPLAGMIITVSIISVILITRKFSHRIL